MFEPVYDLDLQPCGAFRLPDGICEWRVWAPYARKLQLVLIASDTTRRIIPMHAEDDGYFHIFVPDIAHGQRYTYQHTSGAEFPDPASRWQPDGVHGASAVFDPRFQWNDTSWQGIERHRLAIYELHVGAFTPQGTLDAAATRLNELKQLGVTAVELMPIAQFPGVHSWGYDGTYWCAVQNSYGGPRALQRFVDAAHQHGLAVILDVVFNHFGPEGNYTGKYGPYVTMEHSTLWGAATNFDGPHCEHVRSFVLHVARQWLSDFHVDGLRIDAAHVMHDNSPRHILGDLRAVADEVATERNVPAHLIVDSNLHNPALLADRESGGCEMDMQWNNDFHHSLHVLLTGEQHGYYKQFCDPKKQLVKAINENVVSIPHCAITQQLHDGQNSSFEADRYVISTQTHDQVGNRAYGGRLGSLVIDAASRLAAGLMLLSPQIPMLFMGEEYGEPRPFPYFCDCSDADLRATVRVGRLREFTKVGWEGDLPDPLSPAVFQAAILSWRWSEETGQAGLRRLYQDLLNARKLWPELQGISSHAARLHQFPDGDSLLILERARDGHPLRRLTVCYNLSPKTMRVPNQLLTDYAVVLTSESPRYGGKGTVDGSLAAYEFLVFKPVVGSTC